MYGKTYVMMYANVVSHVIDMLDSLVWKYVWQFDKMYDNTYDNAKIVCLTDVTDMFNNSGRKPLLPPQQFWQQEEKGK